jgi:hypothetical protein
VKLEEFINSALNADKKLKDPKITSVTNCTILFTGLKTD